MEQNVGLEPTTYRLQGDCTTTCANPANCRFLLVSRITANPTPKCTLGVLARITRFERILTPSKGVVLTVTLYPYKKSQLGSHY